MTMRLAISISIRRVAIAGCIAALSGCATYRPAPLDLATNARQFSAKTLIDTGVLQRLRSSGAGLPNGSWNRAQLLVVASERNPKLLIARAHVQEAAAAVQTARALPNPTVTLGSDYSLSQTADSPWLWSVSIDWLLDVGLRRRLRSELADAQVRAARVDYAEAVWTTRSELRSALLSYLINDQRLAVLTRAVADQEHLLTLQRQRIALGEAATGEASLVELELAKARSNLADNLRLQTAALSQLAQSLGVTLAVMKQQAFTWDDLIHVTALDDAQLDDLREKALLSRGDLERAVLDYQSRELELQQAVRQQYPQLSIAPGYTFDHGVKKATLGLSFSLPVFNHNQGPIAEADARRTAAGEQAMAVQAQALNEIDAARTTYRASMQALELALQQSDATDALVQQANRALSLGATDRIGVVSAQVTADAQSLAVLDAVERMQQALGQLEDALRTPLSGPELTLSQSLTSDGNAKP